MVEDYVILAMTIVSIGVYVLVRIAVTRRKRREYREYRASIEEGSDER